MIKGDKTRQLVDI